jgi:hypothetical protein
MSISINDLIKEVFVFFLARVKDYLYKAVIDGNTELLKLIPELNNDSPLWMVTGGEAINYYSTASDKTPTKDIDCKLLFVGPYNVPKDLFSPEYIPEEILHLRKYIKKNFKDVLIKEGFNVNSRSLRDLSQYTKRVIVPLWNRYIPPKYVLLLNAGYMSRENILWNGMTKVGNTAGHLAYVKRDGTFTSLNISDLNAHNAQTNEWNERIIDFKDGNGPIRRTFKLYIIKTPFCDAGKNEDAFPYSCGYGLITDAELYDIEQRLNTFYSNSVELWNLYYGCITMMNLRRYLISLTGVCILVDNLGAKYVIQEGILDLFIDFSASESPSGKYIYENKSENGMIPNIIKSVNYCGKTGYIKIPTLNWLIYDQTRMLYHSLRLEEVGHHNWSDEGVTGWQPFEDNKQPKYFSKLKGMLTTYLNVLTTVETIYNNNKNSIVAELQACRGETLCSPSFFISYIYSQLHPTNFIEPSSESIICTGSGMKKRHIKNTKQKKRKYRNKGNKTRHLKK